MSLFSNKKGGILDDFWIVLIIFFAGLLVFLFSFNVWLNFNDKVQALPSSLADSDTKSNVNSLTNLFLFIDKIQPFLFLALWGLVIMSSILVNPDHPFFFLISLGICFIYTVVLMIIVDFGVVIWDSPLFIRASSELGNSTFFMHNLHIIGFFIMVGSLIWFYVKGNIGYGQGSGGNIAP